MRCTDEVPSAVQRSFVAAALAGIAIAGLVLRTCIRLCKLLLLHIDTGEQGAVLMLPMLMLSTGRAWISALHASVSLLSNNRRVFDTISTFCQVRVDAANAHMARLRPYLQQHGIAYEREKFADKLAKGERYDLYTERLRVHMHTTYAYT